MFTNQRCVHRSKTCQTIKHFDDVISTCCENVVEVFESLTTSFWTMDTPLFSGRFRGIWRTITFNVILTITNAISKNLPGFKRHKMASNYDVHLLLYQIVIFFYFYGTKLFNMFVSIWCNTRISVQDCWKWKEVDPLFFINCEIILKLVYTIIVIFFMSMIHDSVNVLKIHHCWIQWNLLLE
jgi:hypothetical protein